MPMLVAMRPRLGMAAGGTRQQTLTSRHAFAIQVKLFATGFSATGWRMQNLGRRRLRL
jgi:hypothetical protein